jgi:type II restriction enzyme
MAKNQSNRLTNQHKQSQGVVGIFGEIAKKHDLKVSDISKCVLKQLEKNYPKFSFRYRNGITKKEITVLLGAALISGMLPIFHATLTLPK